MAYIWKDNRSPYYTACWYDATKALHRRSTKCEDRKEAQRIANEFEGGEIAAQRVARIKSAANQTIESIRLRVIGETKPVPTVETWFTQWLAAKKQTLGPATYPRYEDTVESFYRLVGRHIKTMRLDELTMADITLFRDKRIRMGKRAKTINTDVKIISSALRKAQRQGHLQSNPAEALDSLPSLDSSEREAFTDEQISTLLKAVENDNNWMGAILLGLWTGQRLGDLIALRWESVDLGKGTITFKPQKMIRKNRVIVLPILPPLEKWLRTQQAPFNPNQKVLCGFEKRGIGGRNGLSTEFINILSKLGLRGKSFQPKANMRKLSSLSFHSLRHTFTSWMANNGVPPEIRMKLTGHSSLKVHAGYTHHTVDYLRSVLSAIPNVA